MSSHVIIYWSTTIFSIFTNEFKISRESAKPHVDQTYAVVNSNVSSALFISDISNQYFTNFTANLFAQPDAFVQFVFHGSVSQLSKGFIPFMPQ
jgi:uncharacterized protein (DUF1919 family)